MKLASIFFILLNKANRFDIKVSFKHQESKIYPEIFQTYANAKILTQ